MQLPTNWDSPNPQKNPATVYDPQVLLGTISTGGSLSSPFDLGGWTQFALQVAPTGTILGGTVWNLFAASQLDGTYYQVYGTTGAVASTLQIGSTGNQILSPLTVLQPLRFVKFGAPGTQSAAQTLKLFVK